MREDEAGGHGTLAVVDGTRFAQKVRPPGIEPGTTFAATIYCQMLYQLGYGECLAQLLIFIGGLQFCPPQPQPLAPTPALGTEANKYVDIQ